MSRGAQVAAVVAAALVAMAGPARAQEFSRFLTCQGDLQLPDRKVPTYADFALRFNNRTALVQRSNVLPVGERLAMVPTPALYSMTYRLRERGTQVVAVPGWIASTVLVFRPDLERLNQIRVSVDRQSGALDGVILNEAEQVLAEFRMQCEGKREDEIPAPKM